MKKRISQAQRKHQDYLRRKGLQVGRAYMGRLIRLRAKEVKRVLTLCRDYGDKSQWPRVIEDNLSEAGYLYDWFSGLYLNAGLPQAKSITRDLSRGKAESPSGAWEQALKEYAQQRAGNRIVSLTDTLKEDVVDTMRALMELHPDMSVEKLTQAIYKTYAANVAEWQARRIAQTETMIGLGEAGRLAAESTGLRFVKTWCISGVGNTRETHQLMDGVTVEDNEYFTLPDCAMLYPHDCSTGAPAGEIINCACSCIRTPM